MYATAVHSLIILKAEVQDESVGGAGFSSVLFLRLAHDAFSLGPHRVS